MKTVTVERENNSFQHLEVLKRNREKRARYGKLFVEGVRPITSAVNHGHTIEALIAARGAALSNWAKGIIERAEPPILYRLSPELMAKLSDKEEMSELLAIVRTPADDIDRIKIKSVPLVVIFDRPASPGNLGTSIRSCDAFGADGCIITGHATDLYHPHTIRGSVGAVFSTPVVRLESPGQVQAYYSESKNKHSSLQMIGSSPAGEIGISEVDLTRPTFLVVGNETWGMSRFYKEICDLSFKIPQQGYVDSLNISCATSIILYEAQKQRSL
ncbi:MAG: rRNA methyltransferase [Deltaproteobacteria bacterium]|nr:rRNA methyltransferase [Deltaproteobacteria bacterium]